MYASLNLDELTLVVRLLQPDDVMPWKRFDLYIVKQKELVNSRFVGNFRCYDPFVGVTVMDYLHVPYFREKWTSGQLGPTATKRVSWI